MFFLLWQQEDETIQASAGGAGKFHKKRKSKKRSPPFFELPPVSDKNLPVIAKPAIKEAPPRSQEPQKPKPIDISRFLRKPSSSTRLIDELVKDLIVPPLEFEARPLPEKEIFLEIESIGEESPLFPITKEPEPSIIEIKNTPIQALPAKPKIISEKSLVPTPKDDDLLLWIAALDGEPDAMLMLMTKE